MDRKEKLQVLREELATRSAGLTVEAVLADVRAELAALEPKRWPCHQFDHLAQDEATSAYKRHTGYTGDYPDWEALK